MLPEDKIRGVLQGYKVSYQLVDNEIAKENQVTTAKNRLTLYGLQKFSNYSISVSAFTKIGEGSKSDLIYCQTQEDVPDPPPQIKAAQSGLQLCNEKLFTNAICQA